ncbi:MAG: isocitrate lyase/phosphoenolpyruvate mutase family protein [Actinobacteria bacterium]|nr:isocitrate lyase/phosphoenolpyruvate mutase family protein [Actinomycetota bacterium]
MEPSRPGDPDDARRLGGQQTAATPDTPARRLRQRLLRPGPVRLVGAHDALGARLAEQAGFDGVWASGLEISASHGVPDADILGMTELLDPVVAMVRAVGIPVVTDCGAGYGSVHNVIYTVERHEAAGVAALCFEDKVFPKRNSFVQGSQRLTSVDEFVSKVRAARSARRNPDTMIIARTEAMIAGHGLSEALRRAEAYADAGADAILVHDNATSADRVLAFAARWDRPTPIVAVPTTYYTVNAQELHHAGIAIVVYANHGLRASIAAVSRTFAQILRDGTTAGVEDGIAPLATVFDLQGFAEFRRHESRFVLQPGVEAVVLAGAAPGAGGRPLLSRQVQALRRGGARRVSVVSGEPAALPPDVDVDVDVDVELIRPGDGAPPGDLAALLCAEPSSAAVLAVCGDAAVEAPAVAGLIDCLDAAGEVVLLAGWCPADAARGPAAHLRLGDGSRGPSGARLREVGRAPLAGLRLSGLALLSRQALDSLRRLSRQAWADGRLAPSASLLEGIALLQAAGVSVWALEASDEPAAARCSVPVPVPGAGR